MIKLYKFVKNVSVVMIIANSAFAENENKMQHHEWLQNLEQRILLVSDSVTRANPEKNAEMKRLQDFLRDEQMLLDSKMDSYQRSVQAGSLGVQSLPPGQARDNHQRQVGEGNIRMAREFGLETRTRFISDLNQRIQSMSETMINEIDEAAYGKILLEVARKVPASAISILIPFAADDAFIKMISSKFGKLSNEAIKLSEDYTAKYSKYHPNYEAGQTSVSINKTNLIKDILRGSQGPESAESMKNIILSSYKNNPYRFYKFSLNSSSGSVAIM